MHRPNGLRATSERSRRIGLECGQTPGFDLDGSGTRAGGGADKSTMDAMDPSMALTAAGYPMLAWVSRDATFKTQVFVNVYDGAHF